MDASGGAAEVREALVHQGDELTEVERALHHVRAAYRDDEENGDGADEHAYVATPEQAAPTPFAPLEKTAGAPA